MRAGCAVLVFCIALFVQPSIVAASSDGDFSSIETVNASGRHLLSRRGRVRLHKVSKKHRKQTMVKLRGTVKCGNPGKVGAK
jgi:hypothetical protein